MHATLWTEAKGLFGLLHHLLPPRVIRVFATYHIASRFREMNEFTQPTLYILALSSCWVGKHVTTIVKPTNSPTQGQPNPRTVRFKSWHLGHFFPTANYFFVGWDWFYIGNRLQETQPNQILRKHRIACQKVINKT